MCLAQNNLKCQITGKAKFYIADSLFDRLECFSYIMLTVTAAAAWLLLLLCIFAHFKKLWPAFFSYS